MSISTFSSAMALLFVAALLWILMDVNFYDLSKKQRWAVPVIILLLAIFNQLLKQQVGPEMFGKMIVLTMHVPFFLLFKYLTRCSAIKMVFMIFSGLVFTSPAVIASGVTRRHFNNDPRIALSLNIVVIIGMLLLAQLVFRDGFNYLLKYGDDRLFLKFSIIPAFYYIYAFAIQNVDISIFNSASGYILRYLPTLEVFAFYFMVLNNYKEIDRKRKLELSSITMKQSLDLAEQRIAILNMAQNQTAVYRHDMRHHLNYINGFLSTGKPEQAAEYIRKLQNEIDDISPKSFCENELINLLCSSFHSRAEKECIQLEIDVRVPKGLSVSDTELCSLISNAIENAMNAVKPLPKQQRHVSFYCELKRGKLLIEVKNSYGGEIVMRDGLPVSVSEGHGYGCQSIKAIVEHYNGLFSFETENNEFKLWIVMPAVQKVYEGGREM